MSCARISAARCRQAASASGSSPWPGRESNLSEDTSGCAAAETTRAVVIADDTPQANEATAVQLRRLERKLGFDINMPALRVAGVQVSSKLLRLARVIQE